MAKYAKENGFGMSVATVLLSPMKVLSTGQQILDYVDDGNIDQNAGYNHWVYNTNAVRGQVSEDISNSWAGGVGSFLYQTGMSVGDSAMNTLATGGNKALSLSLMGAGAFANTVVSAKDRGMSDEQALGLGVVSAGAEILTESFSYDKLFGAKDIGKAAGKKATTSVGKYIASNITTNTLEELGAEGINFAADVIIAKDKSQWQDSINQYKKLGKSDSEAWKLAFRDAAWQFAQAAAGGALAGGMMSGPSSVFVRSKISSIGSENSKNADSIIANGLAQSKDSGAYKSAVKLSNKKSVPLSPNILKF